MKTIICKESYFEDGIEYWSKGKLYEGTKHKNGDWSIITNLGNMGGVGHGYLLDDFNEHFSEDPKLIALAKLGIDFSCELELNRAWLYDDEDEDPIGETNFVVPENWCRKIWEENFKKRDDDTFDEFLDVYEPEGEGEFIYQKAILEKVLLEDIGEIYY